jgi:hypothetical protein
MKQPTTKALLLLASFGLAMYLLNRFLVPMGGMMVAQGVSAVLLLAMLLAYLVITGRERDEREQLLRMQADSAALYVVIAGLIAGAILYPSSDSVNLLWLVLGLAAVGRIVAFLYHRYK